MESPYSSFSDLNQHDQGFNPLGLPGQQHGWSWDRLQDPAPVLGSLRDPFDLISTDLDKASPLRLSVVSLEDDELRALAAELQRQGETVLVLDPSREGLNDLARTLQQQGRHYHEIQIFGHGADDSFRVGRNTVSTRTLWRYGSALETIGNAIRPGGDLLLYGCNLAEGSKGKQLIERLATITGADVAASTDLTYADGQSSDWDLEWSIGSIDSQPFHDLLTGLNWQGQLGGTASITGSELRVTGASEAIGISRNSSGIILTGTTQTSLGNSSTVINKVTVSGSSFEISGINLDSVSTDTVYPAAYDVVLNATSADLTVSGAIQSFGGNVSLSSPGKISIRPTNSSAIISLIDARAWSGGNATTTAGNLTINFKSEGRDIPVQIWKPQVNVSLEVGNSLGTGKTKLFANDVTITGTSSIASDIVSNSTSNEGLANLNELLDMGVYGLTSAISPFPASIKSGKTSTQVLFSKVDLQSSGSINLDFSSSLQMQAPAYGSAWWEDMRYVTSTALVIGSTTTELSFKDSNISTNGGDVTIATTSSSSLAANSILNVNMPDIKRDGMTLALDHDKKKEEIDYSKQAESLGIVVGNTKSNILLDAASSIRASGSISIQNTAEPALEAAAASIVFYGGKQAGAATIGSDKTDATIQLDGLIQSDGQVYADPLPATSLFSVFWNYIQAGSSPNYTVTTSSGTAITAAVSLNSGQVVRAPSGDLYKFTGSNLTSLDLRVLNVETDSRFLMIGSSTFAVNENLKVGDEVKVENASTGYALKLLSEPDGTAIIKDRQNSELSRTGSVNTFTVNPGDRILAYDGRHYLYLGSTAINTTLDNLDPSGTNWAVAPLLESGAVMQITAVLDNPVSGKDYVLAIDQPLDLLKEPATGTGHGVYRVRDTIFNASTATAVDLVNNEIILTPPTGSSRDAFGPGQSIRYYVMPDKASQQDSTQIGGLDGDTQYFLIPRGGDRFALAYTPNDALANRAIDLTSLGAGSQHLIHYDLGKRSTVRAQLQPLVSGDYVPPSIPVAQIINISLSGVYEVGDVITITLENQGDPNAKSQDLTYTANSSNLSTIRDGIISLINNSSGIGTGTDSYVQAAAGTEAGVAAITITAKIPGRPILAIAGTTNGSANNNIDNTQTIIVATVKNNITPPNQLNQKLSLSGAPADLGNLSTVQLNSGLLQTSTNALFGAQAFLTHSNVLINRVGTTLGTNDSLTLQPGEVLYAETIVNGTTTGSYRRYDGTTPWSGNASALRSALTNQSTNWLADAGPLLQLIRPSESITDYRLQSTTLQMPSLDNGKLATLSGAGLGFIVQTAAVVFDPATTVDSTNNIITLPGLSATTGDIISYRLDPTFTRAVVHSAFLPVTADGISNGSNSWSGITLPSTALSTSGIYKLTYYSTNPLFASTGRAPASDPLGGLAEGQVLYAKVGSTANRINLFSDSAATQPISLNTNDGSINAGHYLQVDVKYLETSQPIGGISPDQELQVIALGGDRYQLVEDGIALENSLPRTLLGRQINAATRLSKVGDGEVAGVDIKSEIIAENSVEAETGMGGEPDLSDYLSNSGVVYMMQKGFRGVFGDLFKFNDNHTKQKAEGKTLSGALAFNLVQHKSSIEQGSTSLVQAGANKSINIGSFIESTFKNIAMSETGQASSIAVNVAIGYNNINNTSTNVLRGAIETGGEVSVEAETEYPSRFNGYISKGALESTSRARKVSEAGVYLDALYDLTGLIVGEAFNSFSKVRIAGKPKTVKSQTETNTDGTPKENEVNSQAEVGVGIGMNISKITTINTNTIDGRVAPLRVV